MKTFYAPDLGEGLQELEIREWYIKTGDSVRKDQLILSAETDKASVEIPSPFEGVIHRIYEYKDNIVEVGAPLFDIESGEEQDAVPEKASGSVPEPIPEPEEKVSNTVVGVLETGGILLEESSVIKAIPRARKMAARRGIDLKRIRPERNDNVITVRDVENYRPEEAGTASEGFKMLKGVRRAMAVNMERYSGQVVPFTLFNDADISLWPEKSDITVTIIKALIRACRQVPILNAHYRDHALRQFESVHLAIAVDTEAGLYAPVLSNAEKLSDQEIRRQIDAIKEKALRGTLSAEDNRDATITLTNFGTLGGRYGTPVLMPPAVAIVGTGQIYRMLQMEGDGIINKKLLPLSLTADHRAVTGGDAGRFLAALIEALKEY